MKMRSVVAAVLVSGISVLAGAEASGAASNGAAGQKSVTAAEMQALYDEVKTPYKYGVVLAPEKGCLLDNPNVFRADGKWKMTYILFDGKGYETYLAESDDLLHWTKLGKVLSRGPKGAWDSSQADGAAQLMDITWGGSYALTPVDGRYWMTYIGGAADGYETDPLSIGVAHTDAPGKVKEWTRLPQPVLTPSDPTARPFERKTLYKSFVFEDPARRLGGRYVMYYNAKQQGGWVERIGAAVSDDMRAWRRVGDDAMVRNAPPLDHGIVGDPMIQKIGDVYVMFLFGYNWKGDGKGTAFDTFAASRDLKTWTRWEGAPLVASSEPYDSQHAHKPWVVKHNGVVYHFYCAVGEQGRVAALATSKDLRR